MKHYSTRRLTLVSMIAIVIMSGLSCRKKTPQKTQSDISQQNSDQTWADIVTDQTRSGTYQKEAIISPPKKDAKSTDTRDYVSDANEVEVVINGNVILRSDVIQHVRPLYEMMKSRKFKHDSTKLYEWFEKVKQPFIEEIIFIKLMEQEAQVHNATATDDEVTTFLQKIMISLYTTSFPGPPGQRGYDIEQFKRWARAAVAFNKVIDELYGDKISISDVDLRDFYVSKKGAYAILRGGEIAAFEEVRDEVTADLRMQKLAPFAREHLALLKSKATIKYPSSPGN